MKKILSFVLTLVCFNVYSQSMLIDEAKVLSPEENAKIERMLVQYESKTSIEIAVNIISSLNGTDIKTYKYNKFNELGVGKKGANNGLLFVFVINDRKSGVEVGDGLISIVTNPKSYDYLEIIKPYFRNSEYGNGIIQMLNVVTKEVTPEAILAKANWEKEQLEKEKKEKAEFKEAMGNFFEWALYFILCGGFIGYISYLLVKRHKEYKKVLDAKNTIKGLKEQINKEYNYDMSSELSTKIHSEFVSDRFTKLKSYFDKSASFDNKSNDITVLNNNIKELESIIFFIRGEQNSISQDSKRLSNEMNEISKYKSKSAFSDLEYSLEKLSKKNKVLNTSLQIRESLFNSLSEDIKKFNENLANTNFEYKNYSEMKLVLDNISELNKDNNSIMDTINYYDKNISSHILDYEHYSQFSLYTDLIASLNLYAHKRGEKPGFKGIIQSLERCTKTKLNFHSNEYAISLKSLKSIEEMANNMISSYVADIEREEEAKRRKRAEEERIKRIERERIEEEERKRKEKKRREEEEARRRRDSYGSGYGFGSSSSSSRSSSDDSFGGFGGGTSSGMGSDNGW